MKFDGGDYIYQFPSQSKVKIQKLWPLKTQYRREHKNPNKPSFGKKKSAR